MDGGILPYIYGRSSEDAPVKPALFGYLMYVYFGFAEIKLIGRFKCLWTIQLQLSIYK